MYTSRRGEVYEYVVYKIIIQTIQTYQLLRVFLRKFHFAKFLEFLKFTEKKTFPVMWEIFEKIQ